MTDNSNIFLKEISLPTPYQTYIYLSRYSRWVEERKRREHWPETVRRYIEFFMAKFPEIPQETYQELYEAILNQDVLPSMRALWTAGKALEKDNAGSYNCSYRAINHIKAFSEVFYLLLVGAGVGFSVERQEIQKLHTIPDELFPTDTTIIVKDSKMGWVQGLNELISLLYSGRIPKWDVSLVRPAGSRLKTFGGRASGPEPLDRLFKQVVGIFKKAAGRKLNSLECHSIVTCISASVLCGGVRRSALISLSNLSDDRMRNAKTGQWWAENPQFSYANISTAYTEKPDMGIFMKEWYSLYASKSGERGIFNRDAAKRHIKALGVREFEHDFGLNPCGEVILRNSGLCNLSTTIARPDDTKETFKRKIRLAAILGTLQSTLTNFRFLSKEWKRNAEEERLLGVSISGIMDNEFLSGRQDREELKEFLGELRNYISEVNNEYADMIGINPSVSWSVIKPEGNSSQLVNCSSGIHPRHSKYYIRRVQADRTDPLAKMMQDLGVPNEPLSTQPENTLVFSFPMKAPDHSVFRHEMNAIEQLELYLMYKENYTTHNPSITVYVKEDEWMKVGAWVYEHFDRVIGITFLPYSDHIYQQAPYEEITEEKYQELVAKMPVTYDWDRLSEYETEDNTEGARELACTAGVCDII